MEAMPAVITQRPRTLPDCALCGQPTRRQAHRANRGMCTPCRRVYDALPRAEQQTLPLDVEQPRRCTLDCVTREHECPWLDCPAPRPDLTNVVVLDTRRQR